MARARTLKITKKELFDGEQIDILKGHCSDRCLYRKAVVPKSLLFRKVIIPNGLFSKQTLFRKIIVPKGRYFDSTMKSFRIKTFRNNDHLEQ